MLCAHGDKIVDNLLAIIPSLSEIHIQKDVHFVDIFLFKNNDKNVDNFFPYDNLIIRFSFIFIAKNTDKFKEKNG